MKGIVEQLAVIQEKLNAPKNQYNKFGKYNYRSCEDVLQGVKPLLGDAVILISDEIKVVGNRIYVEATAVFKLANDEIKVKAFAREPESQKGMAEPQITGSASSYARKYALSGLLLIDDNKDADSQDNSKSEEFKPIPYVQTEQDKNWITAIRADHSVLEQITDVTYKAIIKRESGI